MLNYQVHHSGSKEEAGARVVVCTILFIFIYVTLVSRSGVRFSFTSLLQTDAILSSTSFFRRDATSVVNVMLSH